MLWGGDMIYVVSYDVQKCVCCYRRRVRPCTARARTRTPLQCTHTRTYACQVFKLVFERAFFYDASFIFSCLPTERRRSCSLYGGIRIENAYIFRRKHDLSSSLTTQN